MLEQLTRQKPIVIFGNVPSKKNGKQVFYVRSKKTGRITPIIMPSENHKKWHKDASKQLIGRTDKIKSNHLCLIFYTRDARKRDLTNLAESVMDLLVDNAYIVDDNYYVVPLLTLGFGGVDRKNPRVLIYEN